MAKVTMALIPWTQTLIINWPQSLLHFEQRIVFLRRLQDEGLVQAFRVHDDEVGARLGDADHEVELWSRGMSLFLKSPSGRKERLVRAAEVADELLKVETVLRVLVNVQFVVGVDASYDKARTSAGEALFGPALSVPAIEDWALLADAASRVEGFKSHFEFGITRRSELPARLSRSRGRIEVGGGTQKQWDPADFPEVSLFCEGNWERVGRVPDSGIVAELNKAWGDVVAEATEIVATLRGNLGFPFEDQGVGNDE